MKLLIANRGEISIRIARGAAELEIPTVAVYSEDDATSLHVLEADEAVALAGVGPRAYLEVDQIVEAATQNACDAVHPGYGFLSESPELARACESSGLTFVGPSVEALEAFGDKVRARELAAELGVPLIRGLSSSTSLDQALEFFDALPQGAAMLIKAVGGGGGRGMRIVTQREQIAEGYDRARSEAEAAFGIADVYVEQLALGVRHVEVQIAGDSVGSLMTLGDRDCSLQRRHQKLIEIAPAPRLAQELRDALADAALRMAREVGYRSLGTFEFLVGDTLGDAGFAFIEANARLQVEHTVTEEVTGIDLVQLQLELARGRSLAEVGLDPRKPVEARGYAIQARVNLETMGSDGSARPSGGVLDVFEAPSGPGVRVDSFGYSGYRTSPSYDSLLAKVIGRSSSTELARAAGRTRRALEDLRIEGVETNASFVRAILGHPDVLAARIHTRFVDERATELVASAAKAPRRSFPAVGVPSSPARTAGAKVDSRDPLAVLEHGKSGGASNAMADLSTQSRSRAPAEAAPDGTVPLSAPMQGTIVGFEIEEGDGLRAGQPVLVMEAMKMEHEIRSPVSGILREWLVSVGDAVYEGSVLAWIEEGGGGVTQEEPEEEIDLDRIRPDLAEVHERHAVTLDAARPDAVEKRRRTGQRTARENIHDLCDPGSFVEHGQLVLTPGTGLPRDEVIRKFPTDGMVTGMGSINGSLFPGERSRCVVMSYDYTVLAGTQGALNHPKTDRMLELAEQWRRPVVLFAEGGGGRAGTGGKRRGGESTTEAGQGRSDEMYRPLDTPTFTTMARLSGLVPLVGITSRWCFAGNAALLGCCDVIIATADSSIGMGGPALIEGGGLGVFRPEEVGPMEIQVPNGVVDVAVKDEAEAVAAARQYLSYFQGRIDDWECADQRHLRRIVPENRLRVYRIRDVIDALADLGSVLELRAQFGPGMVTALARIEGRPVGIVANNPEFLSGAIDSDGSDKAARFLQLCDAFDIPVVVLCDTPGMMVGPEIERTAIVRHCCRLFVTGANLTVPLITVVLRKAYGLGAQAMAGGDLKEPFATVSWPTGEFGGMGLEGQVKLGFRNELAAIEDPGARLARYEELVAAAYERGRALNSGVSFAVDDVIDPADTRRWITGMLDSVPPPVPRQGKKRPNIDTW